MGSPVSTQVRRSSGCDFRPLQKHSRASHGAQKFPPVEWIATSLSTRPCDTLLITRSRLKGLFPVAMQRSSSEGKTYFPVISQVSKTPGCTCFPVTSHRSASAWAIGWRRLVARDKFLSVAGLAPTPLSASAGRSGIAYRQLSLQHFGLGEFAGQNTAQPRATSVT
jgi:hypothetical protein